MANTDMENTDTFGVTTRDAGVKDKMKAAASATKEAGAAIAEDLKARAAGTFEAAKEAVADRAGGMADQVSDAGVRLADKLRDAAGSTEPDGFPARALNLMANGLSEAARGLNARSLSSIMSDTRAFARRNPTLFVLGAAVAGFALMRMVKASDTEPTAEGGLRSALRNQPGHTS